MKTIAELKKDKIILRTTDPARAGVCEMIVDTATKTAKAEGREVTDKDITSAIKKEIKQFTEAIELIKKNNGDASGHAAAGAEQSPRVGEKDHLHQQPQTARRLSRVLSADRQSVV